MEITGDPRGTIIQDMTRPVKTRQDKTRQHKTTQDKARQHKARQHKTRQESRSICHHKKEKEKINQFVCST
jgi:hypothetical protein